MTIIRILEILKKIREKTGEGVFVEIYDDSSGRVMWKRGMLFDFDNIKDINKRFMDWKRDGSRDRTRERQARWEANVQREQDNQRASKEMET